MSEQMSSPDRTGATSPGTSGGTAWSRGSSRCPGLHTGCPSSNQGRENRLWRHDVQRVNSAWEDLNETLASLSACSQVDAGHW